jgi:hypothetical protein
MTVGGGSGIGPVLVDLETVVMDGLSLQIKKNWSLLVIKMKRDLLILIET